MTTHPFSSKPPPSTANNLKSFNKKYLKVMVGISILSTFIEGGAIAVIYGMQESKSFNKFIKENTSDSVYNLLDKIRQ